MPLDAPPPPVSRADAAVALRTEFPALAHLLGPEHFAALAAAAGESAAASGAEAGGLLHGLLVRRDAPLPERLPARLAADVAALEWAIRQVACLALRIPGQPRARPADLAALDGPGGDGWRLAVLEPIRALAIVPVAWRLEAWVRRLHAGRPAGTAPGRQEQHIVVAATTMQGPATHPSPDRSPRPATHPATHPAAEGNAAYAWWFALPPAQGRLLESLALGAPAGLAVDAALAQRDPRDTAEARELIDTWLREGLFARVHADGASA